MTRTACLALLLTGTVALAAPAPAAETTLKTRGDQGRTGTLTLDRAPAVTMQPTRLELRLGAPAPIPPALQARCDLTMPAMPMPPNRPLLRPDNGTLVGEAIFTMAGAWRIGCAVDYADHSSELFVFSLDRVLMQ